MTKEEILAMKAGGDLDALVAKEITEECYHTHWTEDGKDSIDCLKCGQSRFYHQHSQNHSTDISAAWQVVEKMMTEVPCAFTLTSGNYPAPWFLANFGEPIKAAGGDTAPEAICKAALLAKLEAA